MKLALVTFIFLTSSAIAQVYDESIDDGVFEEENFQSEFYQAEVDPEEGQTPDQVPAEVEWSGEQEELAVE